MMHTDLLDPLSGRKTRPTDRHTATDTLTARVMAEYHEMPGLKLTTAQASRLWGIDLPSCEALLERLADERLLARTRDGCFIRP